MLELSLTAHKSDPYILKKRILLLIPTRYFCIKRTVLVEMSYVLKASFIQPLSMYQDYSQVLGATFSFYSHKTSCPAFFLSYTKLKITEQISIENSCLLIVEVYVHSIDFKQINLRFPDIFRLFNSLFTRNTRKNNIH